MEENGENHDWFKEKKYILTELKRLHDLQKEMGVEVHEGFTDLKVQINTLHIKSSVWGLMGGALITVMGFSVWVIKSYMAR